MYSNCCSSCWFEPEIIKIGQSSHKIYSYNIVNFQESMTILSACTKKSAPRIYIYITEFSNNSKEICHWTLESGPKFNIYRFSLPLAKDNMWYNVLALPRNPVDEKENPILILIRFKNCLMSYPAYGEAVGKIHAMVNKQLMLIPLVLCSQGKIQNICFRFLLIELYINRGHWRRG